MVIDVESDFEHGLRTGVENLLFSCAGCRPGDRVLLVHEDADSGYYERGLADAVRSAAVQAGVRVSTRVVPFTADPVLPDNSLTAAMEAVDATIFFARMGDQMRFRSGLGGGRRIVAYALDRKMLASPFSTAPYAAFEALDVIVNRAFAVAQHIRVTCAEGTDFSGRDSGAPQIDRDTTCKRFPHSVFSPIHARGFSGRIAQRGFLTGTGSTYYDPYTCPLEDTLLVSFDRSRITAFDGAASDVAAARAHYAHVGRTVGVDPMSVHSWHAGIHPGCSYPVPAARNFERWGGSAFGNPRILHFHTCGNSPPGEISLNVLDPTILIDGIAVWENGRLRPERLLGGAQFLESFPEVQALFDAPATEVGQGADGRLSAV